MNDCEILSRVIEISNAPVDVDRRLTNMVSALGLSFQFPYCGIFFWEDPQEFLTLRYLREEHPALPLGMKISAHEDPWKTCVRQKLSLLLTEPEKISQWFPAPGPPGSESSPLHFLAALPVIDDIFFYGFLAFFDAHPRSLSADENRLLAIICRQLAGTIRNAQVSLQSKKRIAELSTLHAIGTAISSTSELGELLNRITLSSTKVLQADGALLHLVDEEAGVLKVVSSLGLEREANSLDMLPLGEEAAGIVAKTGEPILVRDVHASAFSFRDLPREISSVVCVPLTFKSRTIGTLTLFSTHQKDRQEKMFDEEDKNLLSTMASQIAMAIENAIILQRAEFLTRDKERMVRELSLLYEVSRSMLTTIKLDQLARIILLGVTLKNRVGFDRAALFLVNEKENVIEGVMGIGPRDRQEADAWRKKVDEKLVFSPEWEIPPEMEKTPYDLQVRRTQIPLNETHSILVKTILEKHSYTVEEDGATPQGNAEIFRWFGFKAFATVPLIAKGKAIGTIMVDNHFTEKPITPTHIGFLTLLSNQAALAIENSRLYGNLQEINTQLLQTQNRLIQSEKLAAMGEMVASITHEIKNPLVSVGGFARRLDRNIPDDSPEKKYMNIILKEVKRLETFLNETLTYSREPSHISGPHDLNRIVEESLSIFAPEMQEKRIHLQKRLTPNLPSLFCDPQQVKQVFINLIINALQAMGHDGTLTFKTSHQCRNNRDFLEIEVGDTGGGIGHNVLDNIFNPFFTTKADGTGLGLAIVHKIITQHRGEIEVANHPGEGANFLVRFFFPPDQNAEK